MEAILLNLDFKIDTNGYIQMMSGYNYDLKCFFYDNGKKVNLTGYDVQVQMRTEKGLEIVQTSNIECSDESLLIHVDSDFTSNSGVNKLQVILIKDGKYTGSWIINCCVKEKALSNSEETSGLKVDVVKELTDKIAEAVETNKKIEDAIKNNEVATKNDLTIVNAQLSETKRELSSQLETKANKSDVAKISSGTPLFASSISGMIDTTRNYVNTTDGYLYSYNGNSFVSSGVKYQEMGISEGQVYSENTSFFIENLFDKLAVEEGGYYNNLNEKVNNANYVETDYIPVLKNQILMLTKDCVGINSQITKFYDINKSFLSGQNTIGDNQIAGQIDQSKHTNCAYIRISLSKASLDKYMITTGSKTPSSIVPFGINFKNPNSLTKQVTQNTIDIETLKNSGMTGIESKWKNKKWCVVGDSITELNNTATIKYHDIIKEKIGCTVYNQGKSGTGYAVSYAGGLAIVDRITDIPSDSDLITVFAGTNDWGRNLTTLGKFSDTTKSTFYGALKLSLQAIIDKFPTKRIGVITPIPRNTYRNPNTAGETLEQYRNAILEVCEYFSIPCLDLYKESGFYVGNSTFNTTYLPDGLHPNNAGHELLAEKIEKWIETL